MLLQCGLYDLGSGCWPVAAVWSRCQGKD